MRNCFMEHPTTNSRLFTFTGGDTGLWRVVNIRAVAGDTISAVEKLQVVAGTVSETLKGELWSLRGVTSNERYVERREKDELVSRQPVIGRPEATCGALIPLRKNAAWWAFTQDERRKIFEHDSNHIQLGLRYLPAVARRLHHCRDLGTNEPFDFLTWFEYAPSDAAAFDELLVHLRASEEWKYVDREVDIRVVRDAL